MNLSQMGRDSNLGISPPRQVLILRHLSLGLGISFSLAWVLSLALWLLSSGPGGLHAAHRSCILRDTIQSISKGPEVSLDQAVAGK